MNLFTHIKNTIFIILGSAILAIFTYSAIAFTEPTQSPPQGNVPAPINTGPVGQTKSGGLTLLEGLTAGSVSTGGITVNGAGTFASLCLGGVCKSLWPSSDFNPNGNYPNLTAGNANTANYANSAGTANTLQGYTVGSGANQIPVTDGGGRLSGGVMPAGSAVIESVTQTDAGTYTSPSGVFNQDFVLKTFNYNLPANAIPNGFYIRETLQFNCGSVNDGTWAGFGVSARIKIGSLTHSSISVGDIGCGQDFNKTDTQSSFIMPITEGRVYAGNRSQTLPVVLDIMCRMSGHYTNYGNRYLYCTMSNIESTMFYFK